MKENVDELGKGIGRAYAEPTELLCDTAKRGVDETEKLITKRQKNMRARRTREENFIITVVSSFFGFMGLWCFISNSLRIGFIFLIIAVIISLLPPLTSEP